jgi:dephospho-CoA kinase
MVRKQETFAIVVSGELGAGKTFAAEYFESVHGFEHLSFVDRIWKPILAERGIEPTRAALQELGIELITEVGVDGLVDQLLFSRKTDRFVIDDARRTEVLDSLRSKPGRLLHLHILAPFDARFPRLVVRDGVKSEDEQRRAEQVSTELTIPELETIADVVIRNDSTTEDYKKGLNRALMEFGFD